ncbi:MAG: hypothetical protein A2Y17_03890 [Clostridiales bacterium GWF2_38_85]|nr:MAG: hypothetical protein A2Y17_03890 [Clostridiales bacterium GWF2_38_85]HBL83937.1 hypothetical protein [Clostridiales bacterium]
MFNFDFINVPIGWIMKFCYNITNSYALALLLFAVFAQLILFPFGIKQQKNSQKQMLLRPQELAIRKKYTGKKDMETQQKMQAEINEMNQKNGFNPMAGCLPMILTLLLIFPLYGAIRNPLTYISSIESLQINRLYGIVAKADEQKIKIFEVDIDSLFLQLDETTGAANDVSSVTADNSIDNTESTDSIDNSDSNNSIDETNSDDTSLENSSAVSDVSTNESASGTSTKSFKDLYKSVSTKGQIELIKVLQNKDNTFTDEQLKAVGIDTATFDKDQLDFDLIAGISLLEQPSTKNWQLLFIPILVFITSVLAQMIMAKWQTPSQIGPDGKETTMPGGAVMKWGMPLMSAVFSMTFNAAIGLYWIYGNVLRVGQSYIMSKLFPLKRWTPEELRDAEREYNKSKKKKKVIMIEVDEDDNSYDKMAIAPEIAEKKSKRQDQVEAEALAKAKALDDELNAKAAELAAKEKTKKNDNYPQMKDDISHDDKKNKKK